MLVTVSGPPGSGKSTLAADLAETLSYEHISGGDIFRATAADRGLSLAAFNELAEEDDSIDRDLDRRLREIARDRDDVVLESRLSGWMAGEYADLKIWLDAALEVRAQRIADREDIDVETARTRTREREASETDRYRAYYGIDYDDRSIYDLAVNTGRWDVPAVLDIVVTAIEGYDPAADEGAVPVEGVAYEF
ncbi:MAG: (d)CMP kinase [Halobacteriaceae archaeon]